MNPHFIFNENYFFVADRSEAINLAVKMSTEKDLLVFTGKAHEQSLCRGRIEYPYDEFAAVDRALALSKT
jgi:UDP-N-acetylmuramoyl-L-alanyl-D-glutamate--2,6-diaminopimelate ligase